jgi:hypothetical protein
MEQLEGRMILLVFGITEKRRRREKYPRISEGSHRILNPEKTCKYRKTNEFRQTGRGFPNTGL